MAPGEWEQGDLLRATCSARRAPRDVLRARRACDVLGEERRVLGQHGLRRPVWTLAEEEGTVGCRYSEGSVVGVWLFGICICFFGGEVIWYLYIFLEGKGNGKLLDA